MERFTYTIRAEFAMHFGPAGRLARAAACYPDTKATVALGDRIEDISRPLRVATMGMRQGDRVVVTTEGPSELELLDVLYQYFEETL